MTHAMLWRLTNWRCIIIIKAWFGFSTMLVYMDSCLNIESVSSAMYKQLE